MLSITADVCRLAKVSPNITMGGGGLAKMSCDKFSLVISLVKVKKSLCHVSQWEGWGVEGEEEMSPSVT
jgi:hypothetical protein